MVGTCGNCTPYLKHFPGEAAAAKSLGIVQALVLFKERYGSRLSDDLRLDVLGENWFAQTLQIGLGPSKSYRDWLRVRPLTPGPTPP